MRDSDLLVIILLLVAIIDTVFAQTILPKMLKTSATPPENALRIKKFVNTGILLCFTIAIVVYITKPLG